jgi:hypothetical protein
MGGDTVTVSNLRIMAVDPTTQTMLIKGAVPGIKGGIVEIIKKDSVNNKIPYEQSQRYFLPNFLNKHWSGKQNITKMGRDVFYPYDLGEKNEKRYFDFTSSPETYAAHHWDLSWIEDQSKLIPPQF